MKNITKRLISLLFAVSLLCLQAAPVFAQGTEEITLGLSSVVDSGGEMQDSDAVSTWGELAAWMDAHVNEGGNVRLDAPIVFDGTYATLTRRPGAAPATLDLGKYGLTVSGDLEMYCPGLTIRGQGGKNASLRVLPGGLVGLNYIETKPGENGAVLWQDEGGILTLEQSSVDEGAVHFATRPIAKLIDPKPEVITAMPGEDAVDKLSETVQVRVFFEGDAQDEMLPVVWNIKDEETAESLVERRRTLVLGALSDMDTFDLPGCILTFLDRPITFTDVLAKNARGIRIIDADFTCPASALTAEAEYSFDEERWETVQQLEFSASDQATIQLQFYEPDYAEDGDLIWDTAQNPTLYLRMHWRDAPNEADAYSDMLAIDGDTMRVSSDTGGNRGGGTDLDPPETLPPPMGGDGTGDEDNSTSETPDPSPEPPSGGGSTTGGESGSSGDTPPSHRPDTVPSELPKRAETPLPPVSSTASIPKTVVDKADTSTVQAESDADEASDAVQTKQTGTSLPSAEPSEPARTVLAPAASEPSASNRAVGQVAAGTAATAGVIALTMTYPSWGKRLTAFLRRLLVKH